ncbi:hypothetical protein ACVDFE_00025 [Lentzea chajnantorensis]
MQLVGVDWTGRRATAAVWTRAGAVVLLVLYLVAAAADPGFWRPSRRRRATAETGR